MLRIVFIWPQSSSPFPHVICKLQTVCVPPVKLPFYLKRVTSSRAVCAFFSPTEKHCLACYRHAGSVHYVPPDDLHRGRGVAYCSFLLTLYPVCILELNKADEAKAKAAVWSVCRGKSWLPELLMIITHKRTSSFCPQPWRSCHTNENRKVFFVSERTYLLILKVKFNQNWCFITSGAADQKYHGSAQFSDQ